MTHGVGTTCWLAPELIKDAKGSERIDVYAFGIVLWELATREEVYGDLSAAQIISRYLKGKGLSASQQAAFRRYP